MIVLLIILFIMILIMIFIVGIYFLNIDTKSNKGITITNGEIVATGNVDAHVEIEKHIEAEELPIDPNKVSLLHQYSIDGCIYDKNYGLINENAMYASDGCRGLFTYKGMVGNCNSINGLKTECPIGSYTIGKDLKIAGINNVELKLLKDYTGKCTQDNWGKYGKNMFVDNGCKGLFHYGPLFGYCTSHDNGRTTCPIGKTIEDSKYEPSDPYQMKYIGLREQHIRSSNLDKLCIPYSTNTVLNYKMSSDMKELTVNNYCNGTFSWGPYSGLCMSYGAESQCPIGSTIVDNNHNTVGMILTDV